MTPSFLNDIGFVGRPCFPGDPLFWVAVGGGAVVAFGIRLWVPLDGPPAHPSIVWIVLSAVIVYPILEELAFRGTIQGWLLSRPWGGRSCAGFTLANLITTAAFTGLHFLYHPPLLSASVAVPSLVFGFFRDRDGTVYPSIALHALFNLFYLLAVTSH
jgi:hypothetical protein